MELSGQTLGFETNRLEEEEEGQVTCELSNQKPAGTEVGEAIRARLRELTRTA